MDTTGASSAPNVEELNKPMWKYVTRLEKPGEGGGNVSWQCNFCNKVAKSSYTRVRAHLLKIAGTGIGACPKVTMKDISEMQKLEEEAKFRLQQHAPKKVPLPPQSFFQGGIDSRKRKNIASGSVSGNPLEKSFNTTARDQLHAQIARMFYSSGLPFHLARNPYYVSSYTFAASNPIAGYLHPGYNLLRTTLLQKEKANIERLLEPIKGTWKEKGVSIVSDGWSDSQRRPLINFMAVVKGPNVS
ncbi:hypothetical protein J5N97_003590 [Dioscorea zingiberensis]|uniref:BED-type domain-containing protein n=1 Tax=Dioscorea zingiberensis TaxID=325984 RepID=A0A9D5HQH6_9LILI|nr:hypothetical protein J5N97_003590 [Dioscorea zingiberensis]